MKLRIKAEDLAIDLGTSSIKVYKKEDGVVINEPTVLVLDHQNRQIKAIGQEAKDMIGKTPDEIIVQRPIEKGVISDFNLTEAMLNYYFQKINPGFSFLQARAVVCVPSGITDIEERAVEDAALHAGSRDVIMVDESLASCFGVGLSPEDPRGILVLNLGAGNSEVCVVSLNGIVASKTLKIGGDDIDKNIQSFLRDTKKIEIGLNTAEKIKKEILSLRIKDKNLSIDVEGRDLKDAKPKRIKLKSEEIAACLSDFADSLVEMIYLVLEKTPPELSSDIKNDGFILTGGMAKVKGLGEYIEKKINLKANVSDNPDLDAIKGAGLIMENPDRFLKYQSR
ncbi:MAG: rod shape-determining protein [Anaerococcus hydrogenalis]|uniref:rod shape-determining protein n=1 Tax=Anaerococcus hydrogenalis TaxID=33029 RepID=UPI0029010DA1|nr:rod shape-determining protein [Anaerococcus hydrogenalis]MDU2583088.1 rod shape-determining protein [Anaerococcus hydrogenalis]